MPVSTLGVLWKYRGVPREYSNVPSQHKPYARVTLPCTTRGVLHRLPQGPEKDSRAWRDAQYRLRTSRVPLSTLSVPWEYPMSNLPVAARARASLRTAAAGENSPACGHPRSTP